MKEKELIKRKNEFIDDEAELSGDDDISEDELELSDDDQVDLDLVDKDAPELDSDQEEEVRAFYHKQLETEDRRAVLLLQEQLEEKDVSIGQRRRRKFRWQTKELMENALPRHYDPDDDDDEGDDDDDDADFEDDGRELRIRRPTIPMPTIEPSSVSYSLPGTSSGSTKQQPAAHADVTPLVPMTSSGGDMSKYLFRDKEVVEALSTGRSAISRVEKDKLVQRELRRVLQSKSIFDQF